MSKLYNRFPRVRENRECIVFKYGGGLRRKPHRAIPVRMASAGRAFQLLISVASCGVSTPIPTPISCIERNLSQKHSTC